MSTHYRGSAVLHKALILPGPAGGLLWARLARPDEREREREKQPQSEPESLPTGELARPVIAKPKKVQSESVSGQIGFGLVSRLELAWVLSSTLAFYPLNHVLGFPVGE